VIDFRVQLLVLFQSNKGRTPVEKYSKDFPSFDRPGRSVKPPTATMQLRLHRCSVALLRQAYLRAAPAVCREHGEHRVPRAGRRARPAADARGGVAARRRHRRDEAAEESEGSGLVW
jgi:hypothetical protein